MKSELKQNKIIRRYYPQCWKVIAFSNHYRVMSPYSDQTYHRTRYFKIQSVDNCHHLSEESCSNTFTKYSHIFIGLKFIKLERSFSNTTFLIQSQQNFVMFSSYISMKKKCNQKVQSLLILRFLKFILKCRAEKQQDKISLQSLVMTDAYQFKIYDVSLYAVSESKSKNQKKYECKNNKDFKIYEILQQINQANIKINQQKKNINDNKSKITETVISNQNQTSYQKITKNKSKNKSVSNLEEQDQRRIIQGTKSHYPQKIIKLIKLTLQKKQGTDANQQLFNQIQILQKQCRSLSQDFQSRSNDLTQTIISQQTCYKKQPQMFRKTSSKIIQNDWGVPLLEQNRNSKSSISKICNKKNPFFISILVICLLLVVGLCLFTYLREKQNICQNQSTYWDELTHHCQSCYKTCQRCLGSRQTECLSCKGKMFLVINNLQEMIGSCMQSCEGRVILKNKCLISLKS